MLRKSTKIKGFKNFDKEITFYYNDITLVKGKNGAGKTTLALDSLLFCLYGYYNQSLSELPTKGKTSCYIEEEIMHDNHNYRIRREYPTKLTIHEDDNKMPFVNSRDAQQFLNKLFKNVEYFKKFRMIDNMAGINILEEGKTSLKRTLLSVNQGFFNNIRKRLLDKKRNQDIYNKDKAVVYSHYPSETRLKALKSKMESVLGEIRGYETDISDLNRDLDQLHRKQGQLESNKQKSQWEKNKLLENESCYACGQELIKGDKDKMLSDKNKEIIEYLIHCGYSRTIKILSKYQLENNLIVLDVFYYKSNKNKRIYGGTKLSGLIIDGKEFKQFITQRRIQTFLNN